MTLYEATLCLLEQCKEMREAQRCIQNQVEILVSEQRNAFKAIIEEERNNGNKEVLPV